MNPFGNIRIPKVDPKMLSAGDYIRGPAPLGRFVFSYHWSDFLKGRYDLGGWKH
jgi:hypothetical protein